MITRGVLLYAQGSPCPTLVLPAGQYPDADDELVGALTGVRGALLAHDLGHVLKIAMIGPSAEPGFDLDYRFVQCMPGHRPAFELRGSCGHSILAAVTAAPGLGCTPPLAAGRSVRVRVRNNGDDITCRADRVTTGEATFTARFRRHPAPALPSMLLFGEPSTEFDHGPQQVRLSGVSLGNPYVFVDGRDVGVPTAAALFAGGPDLFATLAAIRAAAEARLGWPPGAFPKVAAVLPHGDGLAVRAISVPSWHPSLALTGVTCLAAAAAIAGTVPADLLGATGRPVGSAGLLPITTPGGRTAAVAATTGGRLTSVDVGGKVVRRLAEVELPADRPAAAAAGRGAASAGRGAASAGRGAL